MGEELKNPEGEEILVLLKRHLVERVPVSQVCVEAKIQPTQFYRWQARLFSEGAVVFRRRGPGTRQERMERLKTMERTAELEAKLRRKDEVLGELLEEHVALKKKLGGS